MAAIGLSAELAYAEIVSRILTAPERDTRNGKTLSMFGTVLKFDMQHGFPLLRGRKMFYKGVLGELAAILRGPKHLSDFEKFGCNYWELWAKEDGSIDVDYGNAWIDYNGIDQLQNVIDTIKTNPTDRRMIIDAWRPDRLSKLDLPCCHYSYQFYVREGVIDMIWNQRSADFMIGVPSDMILAATLLILIAAETGKAPGEITMVFGDSHIYKEHLEGVGYYLENVKDLSLTDDEGPLKIDYKLEGFTDIRNFVPEQLVLGMYKTYGQIKFKLKA